MANAVRHLKSFLLSTSTTPLNIGRKGFSRTRLPQLELERIDKRYYSPEALKRFYGDVNVVSIQKSSKASPGTWGINLDSRPLRTPNKRLFEVDNEAVAHAVANEWAIQKDVIMLNTMHITGLSNTVIDNPLNKTKFSICNDILSYLPLDTILYRSEENERLWELQRELWDPVLHWFQKSFDVKLPIVAGAITPPHIPEESLAVLRRELMSYRFDAILGLQFAAEAVKSLILTMGVSKMHLTTDQGVRLSSLELDFQVQHWGNVEWSHDIERYDTLSRFSCGMMFFSLNTYSPFRYVENITETTLAFEKKEQTHHHK